MTVAGRYLFEVQARAERATPGPWSGHDPGHDGRTRPLGTVSLAKNEHGDHYDAPVAYDWGITNRADADFIAAARTDVPRLVAAVRAALDVANDLHSAPGITDRRTVAEVLRDRIERELTP